MPLVGEIDPDKSLTEMNFPPEEGKGREWTQKFFFQKKALKKKKQLLGVSWGCDNTRHTVTEGQGGRHRGKRAEGSMKNSGERNRTVW